MPQTQSEARPIGLAELIDQVKRELRNSDSREDDPVPLLAVDQVELEVSFTVSYGLNGKIDLKVVSLGSDIKKEDVQTVRVTFKPLVSGAELLAELRERDPEQAERIKQDAAHTLRSGAQPGQPMSWP